MTAVTVALLGGAAWMAGQGIGLPPFGTPRPGPPVKASLLADVQAVQPGGSVTLAVRLKIDPQWHVYWRNPGQTGLPTRIELTVPKGFKAGPVQVPPPVELSSGGILSYALHDPAVYLIDVQAPPDAPIGQEVTFRAKVKWLACKVQCIPGQAELSLSLPVEPADRPARPANVELFRAARARLPVRADPDAALSLTVRAEPPTVRPGQSFNLAVQVELADGYWIPAHASGADSLAPTELFVDPPAGITTLEVVYPTGRARRLRYVARLRAKRDLQPGTVTIRGLLRYQLRPADGSARPER
ncbi:MAG: protein-disulfide reductase DsbD domain-containing protein, partial [Phycisphaerae bacterium]